MSKTKIWHGGVATTPTQRPQADARPKGASLLPPPPVAANNNTRLEELRIRANNLISMIGHMTRELDLIQNEIEDEEARGRVVESCPPLMGLGEALYGEDDEPSATPSGLLFRGAEER